MSDACNNVMLCEPQQANQHGGRFLAGDLGSGLKAAVLVAGDDAGLDAELHALLGVIRNGIPVDEGRNQRLNGHVAGLERAEVEVTIIGQNFCTISLKIICYVSGVMKKMV